MTAKLVVSLSGITARTLVSCVDLASELDRRHVPLSLLYAPRTCTDASVVAWIRKRQRVGDALLLHGFDHTAEPLQRGVAIGRRAEFAALPAHEANLRLTAATVAMERVGLHADGFAPPRWLASRGTLTALRRKGFLLCADGNGVRDLRSGAVVRGRVHGSGWSYGLALSAARVARRGGLVRISVDAPDLDRAGTRQPLLEAVDVALRFGAVALTYADLVAPGAAAA